MFLKLKVINKLRITLSVWFAVLFMPFNIIAQDDVSKLLDQCENITQQQRQLAKSAGYDIDALCESLKNLSSSSEEKIEQISTSLPRGSQVTTSERGVIGEEDEELKEEILLTQSKKIYMEGENGELSHYGYDLFANIPTTFAPATNIPIPVDYLVGPGDNFQIQLLGKLSQSYELIVGRDGNINFPDLGSISVAGLKFSESKALIQQKIADQMIGVRAVVSLGELRSIRVFVLGEAYKPGSYTVSSLSTLTNALFACGGITKIGSLRNIQLKRQGKIISRLDLYDLLQKGDTSDDARLLPGDVIYIPPVGVTAGIKGEVKRPAIYELKNEKTLSELIRLAGGYSANAYPNISHVTRKDKSGFTTVIDLDLTSNQGQNAMLLNGDLVEISTVLKEYEKIVKLNGNFHRPRAIKWKQGLKLSNVINSIQDFKTDTDFNIGLIIRKNPQQGDISLLHFDLRGILEKKPQADIALNSLDQIWVFNNKVTSTNNGKLAGNTSRTKILTPVTEKLTQQATHGQLARLVEVRGNVRIPGTYPLTKNMQLRDLVLLAGGLKEATYLVSAEVTRSDLSNRDSATVEHITVDLADELMGVTSLPLQPKDKLFVFVTPEYREQLSIELGGEVRLPGNYAFKRGETLSQVIARAGGFTSVAHIHAAIFTRESLRLQESKRLQELKDRMREDIAASKLEDSTAGKASALSDAENLLEALTQTKAIGRLVIDLESIVNGKTDDIYLQDGDKLLVPTFRQEVSVLGEVQQPTSHLFNQEFTLDDYLEKSGGLSNRADEGRIYVVKSNGSVFLPNQSGWLTHQNKMLKAGDTIVVPLDTDKIKSLALWTNVSQIIYQLALGAAAVNSF